MGPHPGSRTPKPTAERAGCSRRPLRAGALGFELAFASRDGNDLVSHLRGLGLEVDRRHVPAQRVARMPSRSTPPPGAELRSSTASARPARGLSTSRCSTRRRLVKSTNYRDFRHRGGAHDTTALRAERARARAPCALPPGTKTSGAGRGSMDCSVRPAMRKPDSRVSVVSVVVGKRGCCPRRLIQFMDAPELHCL